MTACRRVTTAWLATRPAIYRGVIATGGWRGGITEIFSEVEDE